MKDIAIILGIRPDVIRASKILNILEKQNQISYDFIWSGQHYSENMKDTFFNQLNVKKPDFEFTVEKGSDASVVSSTIENLYSHFEQHKYKAAVFLGDTNTVMGCIAAAQHNIPIVHIEGCMRSYDWRMPEEKYRTVIDHLSDRIYAYLENYKIQGMNEGISENIIKVTGNPIVDIINENIEYFESGSDYLEDDVLDSIKGNFVLVTCHRRENILNQKSLKNIINLLNKIENHNVIFPMGYKTQQILNETNLTLNENIKVIEPIGYLEFMYLLQNSQYVATDSGTVVEEACILGIPSIQMRYSTERPEVYDVKASIKFDPTLENEQVDKILDGVSNMINSSWINPFGGGNSSEVIVRDLIQLCEENSFSRHKPSDYSFDISNSFKG
jgi:UDP-N-acetylglucosamine 2-epimerase (non-hydrolysing)